jgi:hypothetical protein
MPIQLDGSARGTSMLKTMVGMVLLADNDLFYASPALGPASPYRFFGPIKTALKEQMKAINACGDYNVAPTLHTLA